MLNNSCVISISGPSGVGKTTIAMFLAVVCGLEDTVVLSGDDLHKWPRGHKKWMKYTHLNPLANNLALGTEQIKKLKNNISILRKKYDHDTGTFIDSHISPKKNIIREGLHTLLTQEDVDLADIGIYVETDRNLKDRWKVARDITKRGYALSQVIDTINKRKDDERDYITVQKANADATVSFVESDGNIELQYNASSDKAKTMLDKLMDFYKKHKEFIRISEMLAKRPDITQNKGGNMSYRYGNSFIITSSGTTFEQITVTDGFTFCDSRGHQFFSGQKRPSMETTVHIKMNADCVLHTHPSYVLAVLCSKEAKKIVEFLYGDSVTFVDYHTPGEPLTEALESPKDIVFAKNHGLFIAAQSLEECYLKTLEVNEKMKEFVCRDIKDRKFLFPDARVLSEENLFLHGFVEGLIKKANLTPDFLTKKQTDELMVLESEKYRVDKK